MDTFRNHYTTYYNALRFTALWPYDNSFLKKVQRVMHPTILFTSIAIQASTLRMIEFTLSNLLQLLSFAFCFILGILRYVGFAVNFPVIRSVFENIENDTASLTDPVETKIMMDQIVDAKRVIIAHLAVAYAGVIIVTFTLLHVS
ncbi:uncharacterized protein LOC143361009 [Halictus rubicundus]|uniref:uncharacterized protein LOC143361009 n=1 Tax=Halictus rubicundus TaxID=77578 RepID=UPI0040350BA3